MKSQLIKETLSKLMAEPRVQEAMNFLKDDYENTLAELKEMVLVSGAPHSEMEIRTPMYLEKLKKYGLTNCRVDEVGNVFGDVEGRIPGTILAEGHLDTVFDKSVPLEIREEENGVIHCPGIADDTVSLAIILSVIRAIRKFDLKPEKTLMLGGTVGEEAPGEARGVRHLMKTHPNLDAYLAVDSGDCFDIIPGAVSCRRHEIRFQGPGGHSWENFGNTNAIMAMSRGFAHMPEVNCPTEPKSSYNVGIVHGGTTVNSIPGEASCHLDIRSLDNDTCIQLEKDLMDCLRRGVAEENADHPDSEPVELIDRPYGTKPGGSIPSDSVIVLTALETAKICGIERKVAAPASTNANFPIAAGIPSMCINSCGPCANLHTQREWYDPRDCWKGTQDLFLNLLALAGLQGVTEPLI